MSTDIANRQKQLRQDDVALLNPHLKPRTTRRRKVTPEAATPTIVGTRSGIVTVLAYFVADTISIALSLVVVRSILSSLGLITVFSPFEIRLAIGFTLATLIVGWYQGLYATVVLKPAVELRQIICSALGLAAFFLTLQWVLEPVAAQAPSVMWLTISAMLLAAVQPTLRGACRLFCGRSRWWGRRVLLVGCGEHSAAMYRALQKNAVYGLRPIGFVEDFALTPQVGDAEGYLGTLDELAERVDEFEVSLGLVATTSMNLRPEISQCVCRPGSGISDWLIVSQGTGLPCLWTAAREVAGMPALGISNRLTCNYRRVVKRSFDLFVATLLAVPVFTVIGILALLVKRSSPGKAFYFSERIGRDGRRFKMWKLRTMVQNADEVLNLFLADSPEARAEYESTKKLKGDPRITKIGEFMRKTSLDELPQLINVFRGEMSLVGPRPMLVNELDQYGDTYEAYRLMSPGITGLWQVNGRNNTGYDERLEYVDYYVKNWSLWLDAHILFCTVKVVLLREGAY